MYDIKRLEMYSCNLVDYHLIIDLIPTLARLYFLKRIRDIQLSAAQAVSIFIITSSYILPKTVYFYLFFVCVI